jgi:hypothetical protein
MSHTETKRIVLLGDTHLDLTVTFDPFDTPREDLDFIFKLADLMREYEAEINRKRGNPAAARSAGETESQPKEGQAIV